MYQYPYGNAQQLNLDWLMEQWQTVKQSIDGSLQGEIDRVEAAMTDLLNARDAAVAAAGAANTSAGAAAASAQAAAADAATATAQAAAANTARSNAAQAANNAQAAAGNAQTQAAAAQNAAGQAAASASQAAADASDAHDDAVAASGSAVNAAASAAGALQNFQLSDAARQAAQAAEQDAEAAATLLQPPATSADIGKALIVKTVGGGTVTAYELGESGGGGGTPAIVQTIEDVPVASFDDGTVNPVQQLVVGIEPVQSGSGDPAPDNVRPITGWTGAEIKRTGKNLGNLSENNKTSYQFCETSYSNNGVAVTSTGNYGRAGYSINLKKGKTYTISFKAKKNGSILGIYLNNEPSWYYNYKVWDNSQIGETLSPFSFTFVATSDILFVGLYVSTNGSTLTIEDLQVEVGSTATTFEPYSGATHPVTFPAEAGTVYGGKLINEGSETWKLSVEYVSVDAGSLSFSKVSSPSGSGGSVFSVTPSNIKARIRNNPNTIICSSYKTPPSNIWFISDMFDYEVSQVDNVIYFANSNYNDVATFTSSMDGVQLVYEIATPVEYTFTTSEVINLLSGYNNVWADTGNIKLLQYYADSKRYIDEQDALIKALIAPVLYDMVADTALTANDFRIVDNTLYRITAPVAAGAVLTPNTNCTATTIGAVLKTLLT